MIAIIISIYTIIKNQKLQPTVTRTIVRISVILGEYIRDRRNNTETGYRLCQ
jgi:hypothetical protein